MPPRMSRTRSTNRATRVALTALAGAVVLASMACSHKSPVGIDDGGGTPEVFFNWLPAFLADQESAQPNHEIMQWLDDEANFPRKDRLTELQAILSRLGNAPNEYRQTAPGHTPADEPILGGIEAAIEQAQAYLNNNLEFEPRMQLLTKDGG